MSSRLLIVTKWGYPFGGGESFMYDSIRWLQHKYAEILWLCFMDNGITMSSCKSYKTFKVRQIFDNCAIVEIPNGITDMNTIDSDILDHWIRLLDPDIVHHQGHDRQIVLEVCQRNLCPMVTGFHFWTGAIKLCETTGNKEIMKNINLHSIDPEFIGLLNTKQLGIYWASDFMRDTVSEIFKNCNNQKAHDIPQTIIYPISSEEHALCGPGGQKNMVTQINVHEGKGGRIFQYCMKHLRHVPFQAVITEPGSELLYNEIRETTKHRTAQTLILNRSDDVKTVYARASIILVPSIVDETFCRVAFEALMNGIPIIASSAGYLPHMLLPQKSESQTELLSDTVGSVVLTSTEPSVWLNTLKSLISDPKKLLLMSIRAKEHAITLQRHYNSPDNLYKLLRGIQDTSQRRRIMIFAPWTDQGLGVQARNYVSILENCHYEVFIFSYLPYSGIRDSVCPAEWAHDNIYYSPNIREHVTNQELQDFIDKYQVGTAIIPETCWFRVFEIAEWLSERRIRVFAIPNVEILRIDEIHKHKIFHGLLCNNQICADILEQYNLKNTHNVGYAHCQWNNNINVKYSKIDKFSPIKFLCIGGLNAFTRKQIDQVCRAFYIASQTAKNIQITITNQNTNENEQNIHKNQMSSLIDQYKNEWPFTFIWKALSYDEICTLYEQCNVVIQVSKHEGLGLGFYESLMYGKPVITLNVPPHNEIIKSGINGWTIPATLKSSIENPMSPIGSAFFDPQDLANQIIEISNNYESLDSMSQSVLNDYASRFDTSTFANRFINALRIH